MQKITFDTGIKTYQINESGVLRFNPSDPNLYKRFKDLRVEIEQIQKDYNERSKSAETGEDAILSGANVMAVASNGELVITNFLDAMFPIVEDGVKTYAKMEAQKAVQEARNK